MHQSDVGVVLYFVAPGYRAAKNFERISFGVAVRVEHMNVLGDQSVRYFRNSR